MSSIAIKLQGLLSSLNRSSWQVCTLGNMTNVRFLWIQHMVHWWDFFLFFLFAAYSHGFSTFQTCKASSYSTSWSRQLILGTTKASRPFNKCYFNRFDMKKTFNTSVRLVPSFVKQPWGLEITAFASWGRDFIGHYWTLTGGVWGLYSPLHSGQQWVGHPQSGHSFGCARHNPPAQSLSRPRAPQGSGERHTQERKPQRGDDKLRKDTDQVLCTVSSYFIDYPPRKCCSVLLRNEFVCPSSQELKLNCLKN